MSEFKEFLEVCLRGRIPKDWILKAKFRGPFISDGRVPKFRAKSLESWSVASPNFMLPIFLAEIWRSNMQTRRILLSSMHFSFFEYRGP